MTLLGLVLAGLVAGSVHVLSGPDHLAALAPLGAGRRRGWTLGALWGLGHAAGVALLGGLILLFRGRWEPALLSAWGERLVGVVLVGLGLWGLRKALSPWLHAHTHRHGEQVHTHLHWHPPGAGQHHPAQHRHGHASFLVGSLHGVAGGSHLLGVLPTLALPSSAGAAAYLGGYATGTIVAMSLFAALLARVTVNHGPFTGRVVLGACSGAAILVGGFWLMG
ncbi:MAG: High-affinity nickel transporter [Acidobacteria bacterium]|nr:MAG: High-affinity nickel transporter [Acidobacteriota bacterium]